MKAFIRVFCSSILIVCIVGSTAPTANAGSVSGKTAGLQADTMAVLQYLGKKLDFNIVVSSGCRSKAENDRVGGASNSVHMTCKAVDLSTRHLSETQRVQLVKAILENPSVKGFGFYTDSKAIHFDTRPARVGKGYWGGSGKAKYSSAGFDAAARAKQINGLIVEMVYRWSKTGNPGAPGDAAPLQNVAPDTPSTVPSPPPRPNDLGTTPAVTNPNASSPTQPPIASYPSAPTISPADIFAGFNTGQPPTTVTTCTGSVCVQQTVPSQNLGGFPAAMYSPNANQFQNPFAVNPQMPITQAPSQYNPHLNNQNTVASQFANQFANQQTPGTAITKAELDKLQQEIKQQQELVRQQQLKLLQQLQLLTGDEEHDHYGDLPDNPADQLLAELNAEQKRLLLRQLQLLAQQEKPEQSISGKRAVTVVAAPNLDYWGFMLTDLVQKLRAAGQDVIVLPDSENYQTQLDRAIAQIKTLGQNPVVNCVGWSKGALGCIALSKQLNTAGIKMQDIALIAPNHSVDNTSVPGVLLDTTGEQAIDLDVLGKVTMYVSTDRPAEEVEHLKKQISADETKALYSVHGYLSLGFEAELHSDIVAKLTASARNGANAGIGDMLNVNLTPSAQNSTATSPGQNSILLRIPGLSALSNSIPSPWSLLNRLGSRLGTFFGFTNSRTPYVYDLDKDTYFTLVQELVNDTPANTSVSSDLTTAALRANNTTGQEYRFRGSVSRTLAEDQDAAAFNGMDSYFGSNIEHELQLDLKCDGTIDTAVTFGTPYYSILPRTDGADVLLSEYLEVSEEGLHCFAFTVDVNNVIPETDEDNNQSNWREFIAGFGGTAGSTTADLPPLNFQVSAYTNSYDTITQDWTNGNITVAEGHELAFRWNATQYQKCVPLLSALTPGIAGNLSPVERNTLSESIDLDERTGYYELRCMIDDEIKTEFIHVTVE